jgi:hypothetical protein
MNRKGRRRTRYRYTLTYNREFCLETRATTTKTCQDRWCPGRNFNQGHPKLLPHSPFIPSETIILFRSLLQASAELQEHILFLLLHALRVLYVPPVSTFKNSTFANKRRLFSDRWNRSSSVDIAARLRAGQSGVRIPVEATASYSMSTGVLFRE